ncbi:MAG: hypothetical protein OEL83_13465 [Desulforhopalus sp.]|nr:hypothetical protein [Desulforhopalus sp.]
MKIATKILMKFAVPQAGIVNAVQYPGKTWQSTAATNSNSITTQHFNYHIATDPHRIRTEGLPENAPHPGHHPAPYISMTGGKRDISTEETIIP